MGFGQNQSMSQTVYVTNLQRYYTIVLDNRLDKTNVNFINDHMIEITHNIKDYLVKENLSSNAIIALFTTSNARLRLYAMLEKWEKAVIYFDTDSINYIGDGNKTVETGCMLGELADELGENWIKEFTLTGPKTNYFRTNDGKHATKINGFSLSYHSLQKLNGETIIDLKEYSQHKEVQLEYNQITSENQSIRSYQ